MTQLSELKKDFENAISLIQKRIEDLSKNKFKNDELIIKIKDENNILKLQIEELNQLSKKDKEPEFGFINTSNIENTPSTISNYEDIKSQHKRDIDEVQIILDQLKDLIGE